MMIRLTFALNLALLPAATADPRITPQLRCEHVDGAIERGTIRNGKMIRVDGRGTERPITGAPDERLWSCLPSDGRKYPVDPT